MFEYRGYTIKRMQRGSEGIPALLITYDFAIPGLAQFAPTWEFPCPQEVDPKSPVLQALVFSLGMAETISYWKCCCPKTLKVLCGSLNDDQRQWWRDLYWNGLGEFLYRNHVETSKEELVNIVADSQSIQQLDTPVRSQWLTDSVSQHSDMFGQSSRLTDSVSQHANTASPQDHLTDPVSQCSNTPPPQKRSTDSVSQHRNDFAPLHDPRSYIGTLVPVGGGKDSCVTLELMMALGEPFTTYQVNHIISADAVVRLCNEARIKAGSLESPEKPLSYVATRTIDPALLALNKQGCMNGHTPFSAIVAFSGVIAAYLLGCEYIALSNESSADESTVAGLSVNHQYSKSGEFEYMFDQYIRELTDSEIHYYSALRPLSELQIAELFSKRCDRYFSVFRSCNAGSKTGVWCCSCSKCLFVYIVLLPFLGVETLREIFKEDLLDKPSLEPEFRKLAGIDPDKPFDCVGTRAETVAALAAFVASGGHSYLTDRYLDALQGAEQMDAVLSMWRADGNVPSRVRELLHRWVMP